MTKRRTDLYPEYANIAGGWRAHFCKRLTREGRLDKAKLMRAEYKKKTPGVSNDESWVWLCDQMTPIVPKHDLSIVEKPKPSETFNPPNFITDAIAVQGQQKLSLYEEARWAFENRRVEGVGPRHAPTTGAYEFLVLFRDDAKLFMAKFLDLEKRYAKETGRDWIKDDDELADLLEGLAKELRAPEPGPESRLPVDGSNGPVGEHAVPPEVAPDLPGELRPSETSQTGVQEGLPVLGQDVRVAS
jgi:hypothetical protein